MNKKIILLLISLLTLCGCSTTTKIASMKPEPDNASPLAYESTTSFISLPVSIKLADIEGQINKYLAGLIYEDKNIQDDDFEIKIWKLAPISLSNEKNKIKTVLPLKVHVKYRLGTSKLGVDLYNTREFNLNGTLTLLSDVSLNNWQLGTATQLKSLDWNESPTTNVMGKNVPITYLINPAIKIFRNKIENTIDESIRKSTDFKSNVLEALRQISEPFSMNEQYQTWLRIVPAELYSTNAQLDKESISLKMGLKCTLETLLGAKPQNRFDGKAIVLKPVSKMPDKVTANIVAVSTYEDASKIITKNFKGQEFSNGSRKVKVENVNLWHKQGKMVVALDLTGSINGTVYLSGFPQYNAQTKEIYFDQLDYALDTKSALMKTANWMAQGIILNKIREACRYSIKPNLEEGKQNLKTYLNKYSPYPGVFVNGSVEEIEFSKIQLTNRAIVAFLKIDGKVAVTVDGLK